MLHNRFFRCIVLIGKNLARDVKAWTTSSKCRSQRDGDSQSYRTVQLQDFQITLEVDLQEISLAGNKHLKSRFPKIWYFLGKWTNFGFYPRLQVFGNSIIILLTVCWTVIKKLYLFGFLKKIKGIFIFAERFVKILPV